MFTGNLQTLEGWLLEQCSMDLLVNIHVEKEFQITSRDLKILSPKKRG
jgi:hypothetical protein